MNWIAVRSSHAWEQDVLVSDLGSMLHAKHTMRPLALMISTLISQEMSAQLDMRFFVGDWHFSIWGTADISAPPALTGTWHLENGLDSALALVGRVILADGPGVQGGLFTRELIAYDAHAKRFQRTIVTNTGASYSFVSEGWHGDNLLWTGTQQSASGEVELREEIERTGPDSFTAIFLRKDGDAWVLQSNERLTRKR